MQGAPAAVGSLEEGQLLTAYPLSLFPEGRPGSYGLPGLEGRLPRAKGRGVTGQ